MGAAYRPRGGLADIVQPVRADDDDLIRNHLAHVSKEDLRLRFFDSIKEFLHQFIARLIDLDYARDGVCRHR
jgi:hypothetical protein